MCRHVSKQLVSNVSRQPIGLEPLGNNYRLTRLDGIKTDTSSILLLKPKNSQAKEFDGTTRFIAVLRTALHWSLS
jgi:hypothetical protein